MIMTVMTMTRTSEVQRLRCIPVNLSEFVMKSRDTLRGYPISQELPPTWNDCPPLLEQRMEVGRDRSSVGGSAAAAAAAARFFLGWGSSTTTSSSSTTTSGNNANCNGSDGDKQYKNGNNNNSSSHSSSAAVITRRPETPELLKGVLR